VTSSYDSELQRTTQNAALSALSRYVSIVSAPLVGTQTPNYAAARDAARIEAMRILGIGSDIGQPLRRDPQERQYGIDFSVGTYIWQEPIDYSGPCQEFPCYIEFSGAHPAYPANAARVTVDLAGNN